MCLGSEPPQGREIPDPPPEQAMRDFFNYITGSQTITVTGADGKQQRVTQRLPRSKEAQARFSGAEALLISTVENIHKLHKLSPNSIVDFKPFIDTIANTDQARLKELASLTDLGNFEQDIQDFKDMQRDLINDEFNRVQSNQEMDLGHAGYGSSTQASESRAAMARQRATALAHGNVEASRYGRELAERKLATNANIYNLNESGREGQIASQEAIYGINKGVEAQTEERRRQAMQEQLGLNDLARGETDRDTALALADTTRADSLADYQAINNVAQTRHANLSQGIQANNKMHQDAFDRQPASLGERLVNFGSMAGGAYLTGGLSLAGGMGNNSFNGKGQNPVGTMQGRPSFQGFQKQRRGWF